VHAGIGDAIDSWLAMVDRTQAAQPHWITPLVTVTPRLEQEFRTDFVWEDEPKGRSTTVYGNGKGLELIPLEQVEIILGIPPYIDRSNGRDSGFGDASFLVKYRLLAANESEGNYILTAFLGLTVPTGDESLTSHHTVFTPTLAAGKGWGDFAVQSTVAVSMPDNAPGNLGTPVLWNTALQYRVLQKLWPEFEVNFTSWPNGDKSGKTQVFLTPGLVIGRVPLWGRLGLTVGSGVQVAATHTRSANHNVIFTARLPF
jgi:hypothetical protein